MDYEINMSPKEYRKCLKIHGYIFSDESLSENSDDEYNQELLRKYEVNKPPPIQIDPSIHKIVVFDGAPKKKVRQTNASASVNRDPQNSVANLTKSQKKRMRKKLVRNQIRTSNETDVSPKPVLRDASIDNEEEPLYFSDEKVETTQEYDVAHDPYLELRLKPYGQATIGLDESSDSFKDLSNEDLPFSEEENVFEDARTQNDSIDSTDGPNVTDEDVVVSEESDITNDSSNNHLPFFLEKNVLEDVPIDLTTSTKKDLGTNLNISFGDMDSPVEKMISTPSPGVVFCFDKKQEVKLDFSSSGQKYDVDCEVNDGNGNIDVESTNTSSIKMAVYKSCDDASICDNSVDLQLENTPKKKGKESKTSEILRNSNSVVGKNVIPMLEKDKKSGQYKTDNVQKGCSLESSYIADAAPTDDTEVVRKKRKKRGKGNKGKSEKVIKSSELTLHHPSPCKLISKEVHFDDPRLKIHESRRDKSDKTNESNIASCSSMTILMSLNVSPPKLIPKETPLNDPKQKKDEPKKNNGDNIATRKGDKTDESTIDAWNSKSVTEEQARKLLHYMDDIDCLLQVKSSIKPAVSILAQLFRAFNKIIEDNLTVSAMILPQITILENNLDDLNLPLFNCFCCICNILRRLAVSFENYLTCKDELRMDAKEYLYHVDTIILEAVDDKNYVSDLSMANSGVNKYAYDLLNATLVFFVKKIVQVINPKEEDLVFLCNDVVKMEYIRQNHVVPYMEKVARAIRKKRKCSKFSSERFRTERYLALIDRKPDSFRAMEKEAEKQERNRATSSRASAKVKNSEPKHLPAVADDKVPTTLHKTEVESRTESYTRDLAQAENIYFDFCSEKGDSQTSNVKDDTKDISVDKNSMAQ